MRLESGLGKDGQMKRKRFTEEQIIGILKELKRARRRPIWRKVVRPSRNGKLSRISGIFWG